MLRLWAYELLTQAILFLAWIRKRLFGYWQQRRDRTFYVPLEPFKEKRGGWCYQERWHCCDCDLVHLAETSNDEKNIKLIPIRPKGYRYKLRATAEKPTPFVDEASGKSEVSE